MGGQLASIYNIDESSASTGGPSDLWKVYSATKKSNGVQLSLFARKKKDFNGESKLMREQIFAGIRKEAKALSKLRHPSILHVLEPLKEDQKIIYFTTEPIQYSLKYLMTTPSKQAKVLSELELKTQLLELAEVISFLHNNAHIVHLDISPENIYVTTDGKLKLAGFFFSQALPTPDATISPNIDYSLFSPTMSFIPNFGFTAPEVPRNNQATVASDAFAMGCLVYNLLKMANQDVNENFFELEKNSTKQNYLEKLRVIDATYTNTKLATLKSTVSTLLSQLLAIHPEDRYKLNNAHDHPWFNDPKIKTLNYLDHLNEKEEQHQIQFLNGLVKVLNEFDSRVALRRILPKLAGYLENEKLATNALSAIIAILERENFCTKDDFYKIVWPHLKVLCTGKAISAQILFQIIKNTEIWLKLVDMQDFQSTLLILYQKGIECGVPKIQEIAIKIIPTFEIGRASCRERVSSPV